MPNWLPVTFLLFEVINTKQDQVGNAELKRMLQTIDTLEFRDVPFAYRRLQTPVLRHLNFRVQRGQHVAIVGSSGSGK